MSQGSQKEEVRARQWNGQRTKIEDGVRFKDNVQLQEELVSFDLCFIHFVSFYGHKDPFLKLQRTRCRVELSAVCFGFSSSCRFNNWSWRIQSVKSVSMQPCLFFGEIYIVQVSLTVNSLVSVFHFGFD